MPKKYRTWLIVGLVVLGLYWVGMRAPSGSSEIVPNMGGRGGM